MIRLEGVSKRFAARENGHTVSALQGFDLAVAQREFVCVVGPSGCGKSTLLNLIAGFERPTEGRIHFNGHPVSKPSPECGFVFQDPALFPWLNVLRNVAFGLRNQGVPKAERRAIAMEHLRLVGLADCADAMPHTLSGGMKQRVALARVLAMEPAALLMDEPFGALDPQTRERLQDELLRIWSGRRKALLFVTHNVEEAVYLADRIVIMGHPPRSKVGEIVVTLPRPRERLAHETARQVLEVRQIMAAACERSELNASETTAPLEDHAPS